MGRNGSERYSKATRLFSTLFPHVWDLFTIIKEKDHNRLAILLTRVESYTILQRVAPRIVEELAGVPFLTRHDSLLPISVFVSQDVDRVKKIIGEVIQEVKGLETESIQKSVSKLIM